MRTKLFFGIFIAMLLATMANAQQIYNPVSLGQGGFSNVLQTVTGQVSTNPPVISVGGQQNVAIAVSGTLSAANTTSNVVYFFQPSVDGILYDSNRVFSISSPMTGPGINTTTISNFNVGGYGFLRLYAISNNTSIIFTNGSIKYGLKLQAP